jgi:hypothetical protein
MADGLARALETDSMSCGAFAVPNLGRWAIDCAYMVREITTTGRRGHYVTSDADFENRKAISMGDATFDRMKKAKESYHPKAISIPGVHATSIGVKRRKTYGHARHRCSC